MSSSTVVAPMRRRGIRHWVSAWLPVAIGCAIIACESTAYFGADHTTGPLRALWQWLFGPIGDDLWDLIHHLIRKTGHFAGYGLLGLVWLRAWWMTCPRMRFVSTAILALLGTALVASSDEIHQTFLPNRTGSAWDVLLDCAGALVLLTATWLILRISARKRLARAA